MCGEGEEGEEDGGEVVGVWASVAFGCEVEECTELVTHMFLLADVVQQPPGEQ